MLIQSNIVTKAPSSVDTSVTGNAVGAFLSTPQPNYGKVEAAVSAASFDNITSTLTAPSSTGQTLLLYGPSIEDPNVVRITPYSSANNSANVAMRLLGWNGYPFSSTNLVCFSETFNTEIGAGTNTWSDTGITRNSTNNASPTGTLNALRVTSTAANATVTNITGLSTASRTFSIWLRRVGGTGTINITADGSTWAAVTLTSTWTRFQANAAGSTCGVRIVTSGDSIEMWGAQFEVGQTATGYVRTTTTTAAGSNTVYVPTLLADVTAIGYGTTVPFADFDGARRHFFGTMSVSGTGVHPAPVAYTPGNAGVPASLVVDTVGSQFVTLHVQSAGAPTLGALWCCI